jgi:hypothetical protein
MKLGERVARRFRYGKPIVVVSGLPRSGTSLMMNMLDSGGVPLLTDGIRTSDDSNPRGYFEYEPVKELGKDGDRSWVLLARGKAVKIVSFLLTWLPETCDYRVVFMQRDLDEIIASQNQMMARRGEPAGAGDASTRKVYAEHLQQMWRFLASRGCFRTLPVGYRDVVDDPGRQARRLREFLDRPLDVARMAAAVDRQLYRNRRWDPGGPAPKG